MSATNTTMIHVRIDKNIKEQAAETLDSMGLSVSDAIRVFLTRIVADQELPFAIKAPNTKTRKAMSEANEIIQSRRARFSDSNELIDALEKNSIKQKN